MKILLLCLAIITITWLLYRAFFVKRKSREKAVQKLKVFQPLLHQLGTNDDIDAAEIMPLAENPSTRHALFGILTRFGRVHLFPRAYLTIEKSAESFLVNWLEFPTELNAPPDKIELFTAVTLADEHNTYEYLVFKYKKAPPPKGLSDDWMLAVTGPFGPDTQPFDMPLRIFSRFNPLGTISATEEVQWVHQHINRK